MKSIRLTTLKSITKPTFQTNGAILMNDKKIILLTGTPGTGKTTAANQLKDSYKVINLTQFIKENNLGTNEGEIEVEINKLREEIAQEIQSIDEENIVIEGHLAHYLEGDYCIVLRLKPELLEERLQSREYSEKKVGENVEAEKMDLILSEAVSRNNKVREVDTTGKSVGEVVREIRNGIENRESSVGVVDWTGSL